MSRDYRAKNAEKQRAHEREYYAKNKERVRDYQQSWMAENEEKMRAYRREYMREYRRTNPNYAIRHRVSNRIRELVIGGKATSTTEYLGCSINELRAHLEAQFTGGMDWNRFLAGDIHIDHIRPCCSFDLTDPEQQKTCFHWTNLRPLWKVDNLKKISQDLEAKRDKMAKSSVSL